MQKKILITGATGFIGSHLVETLLEKNIKPENIRLIVRNNSSRKFLPKKSFDYVVGDIRNKLLVHRAVKNVDSIFHLAAGLPGHHISDNMMKTTNIDGTQYLLDAAKKNKTRKFIFVSSVAIYGLPAWIGDITNWDESQNPNPKEIYGLTKLEAELRVKKAGIPYSILRPTSVYGPRDLGHLFEFYSVIKKGIFFIVGNGRNKLDFVYVKDLITGILQAEKSRQESSEFILSGKEHVTLRNLSYTVAKSIDASVLPFSLPTFAAYPLSFALDSLGKPLGFHSPLYPARVRAMTSNYFYNCKKAQHQIGYQPTMTFKKGSEIAGKWYLSNKFL